MNGGLSRSLGFPAQVLCPPISHCTESLRATWEPPSPGREVSPLEVQGSMTWYRMPSPGTELHPESHSSLTVSTTQASPPPTPILTPQVPGSRLQNLSAKSQEIHRTGRAFSWQGSRGELGRPPAGASCYPCVLSPQTALLVAGSLMDSRACQRLSSLLNLMLLQQNPCISCKQFSPLQSHKLIPSFRADWLPANLTANLSPSVN